ncbi:MAG: hypothetical protein Fur0037_26150 [Planctomycetota bacterium]
MNHCAPVFVFLPLAIACTGVPQDSGGPPRGAKEANAIARDDRAAESLGWRLAVQAWTFRDRTAHEAIDTARRLGLRYIELYPGQALSPDRRDHRVDVAMPTEDRVLLLSWLDRASVKLVNFGVVGIPADEAKARAIFEFAKTMGVETLTCEPEPDAWDLAERFADEYGIALACHNHPKPSRYWDPRKVLEAVNGRSLLLGACADTGHWPRSGLDPLECLKQLGDRVRTLHFKDIAPADRSGIDRPWGTGEGHAAAMLDLLRERGFRGVFSIEYETGKGEQLERNVARCIEFFDEQARRLAAGPRESKGRAGRGS